MYNYLNLKPNLNLKFYYHKKTHHTSILPTTQEKCANPKSLMTAHHHTYYNGTNFSICKMSSRACISVLHFFFSICHGNANRQITELLIRGWKPYSQDTVQFLVYQLQTDAPAKQKVTLHIRASQICERFSTLKGNRTQLPMPRSST